MTFYENKAIKMSIIVQKFGKHIRIAYGAIQTCLILAPDLS